MPRFLTFNVIGIPIPQGSKKVVTVKGRPLIIDDNKRTKPWRKAIHEAAQYSAQITGWTQPTGPVRVDITYYMPRPKAHYGTGRNSTVLKATAPTWCDKKPDRDKLDRAINDSLTTSGVIRDDAQNVAGASAKRYADAAPGARITITPLTEETQP